jgi:hypothetical protein
MEEVDFGLMVMAWNEGIGIWLHWNGLEWRKNGFGPTGMARAVVRERERERERKKEREREREREREKERERKREREREREIRNGNCMCCCVDVLSATTPSDSFFVILESIATVSTHFSQIVVV